MVLELAENGRGKYVYVNEYKRRSRVAAHKRKKPKGLSENYNPYIYVPAHLNDGVEGVFLREDHFDDLSENAWDSLMDELLDHQPEMAELSGKGRRAAKKEKKAEKKAAKTQRKAAKKEGKQKKKNDKVERKNTRVNAKASARQTKADAKKLKGQAKIDKANNSGGESDGERAGGIFDTIVDKASGAYQKFKGGGGEEEGGGDDSGSGGGSSSSETILGMPKMVAIGAGVVLLLGIGYVATRPKSAA